MNKATDIRLETENKWVPDGLYKQCQLIKNPKVFYIGMQNQLWTMNMFQLQGFYARDVINGEISIPTIEEMKKSYEDEAAEEAKLATLQDMVHFQAKYVNHLTQITNSDNCDTTGNTVILKSDCIYTFSHLFEMAG